MELFYCLIVVTVVKFQSCSCNYLGAKKNVYDNLQFALQIVIVLLINVVFLRK